MAGTPGIWWGFPIGVHLIAVTATYWMAIVSIISAVDYFVAFWRKIDHASAGTRKRRKSSVLSRRRDNSASQSETSRRRPKRSENRE